MKMLYVPWWFWGRPGSSYLLEKALPLKYLLDVITFRIERDQSSLNKANRSLFYVLIFLKRVAKRFVHRVLLIEITTGSSCPSGLLKSISLWERANCKICCVFKSENVCISSANCLEKQVEMSKVYS